MAVNRNQAPYPEFGPDERPFIFAVTVRPTSKALGPIFNVELKEMQAARRASQAEGTDRKYSDPRTSEVFHG